MKVKRNVTIDTEVFEVGDVIKFKLTDGEKVRAKAVKETPEGMLFLLVDCLAKDYPMFKYIDIDGMDEDDMTYMNSDLRKVLNGEILARFPEKIRSSMVAVNEEGDMLRIPSEKEIFGRNAYGQDEDKKVKRLEPMKKRRNRMAFHRNRMAFHDGKECTWCYWLMNRHQEAACCFVIVINDGGATYYKASLPLGVRPMFRLAHCPIEKK